MFVDATANKLIQAQAHAEANPLPTTLKLWRDGVAVEMWKNGRRMEQRVTWSDIDAARINPLIDIIDRCNAALLG